MEKKLWLVFAIVQALGLLNEIAVLTLKPHLTDATQTGLLTITAIALFPGIFVALLPVSFVHLQPPIFHLVWLGLAIAINAYAWHRAFLFIKWLRSRRIPAA